jgi:hypothetical protein
MNISIILAFAVLLCSCISGSAAISAKREEQREEIINYPEHRILGSRSDIVTERLVLKYFVQNGFFSSFNCTRQEFRRALRQFQRENELLVTGTITEQTVNFINENNKKNIVIEYLKKYNFIYGDITPRKLRESVLRFQTETGAVPQTGEIDFLTYMFVIEHPHGCSGGLNVIDYE